MSARILQVAPLPPPAGGIAVHVSRLREALVDRGWKVRSLDIAPFMRGSMSWSQRLRRGANTVLSGLERWAPDLIHVHSSSSLRTLALVRRVHGAAVPMVLSIHSGLFSEHARTSSPRRRVQLQTALESVGIVLFAGVQQRDHAVRMFPTIADRAEVIEPLIVTRRMFELRSGDRSRRQRPMIGTSGLWRPVYRYELVVEAFERLIDEVDEGEPSLRVIVSTAGRDTRYRRQILGRIASSAARGRIHVVEDGDDFLADLARCDVYVRATTSDSYGMAMREAVLLGVPVTASDACRRPVWAIPFGTDGPEQLVRALRQILTNPPVLDAAIAEIETAAQEAFVRLLHVYRHTLQDDANRIGGREGVNEG